MADTLPNVPLPKGGEWIDLYAATGITVGEVIEVHSLNSVGFDVAISETQPSSASGYEILTSSEMVLIPGGSSGAWARSVTGTSVNVSLFKGTQIPNPAFMVNSFGQSVPGAATQFLDNIAFVDHFGQAITGQLKSDVSVNFAYGVVDTDFDVKVPVTTGDGAVTASAGSGGFLQASSTTGTANVESRDSLRYSNGRGFFVTNTASFEGSGIGWAGGFDGDTLHDGFPLKYTGATDTLEFGYLKEGVFTGAVEVDHVALGLDLTKLNIWCVIGGFLGVANPTLLVKMDTWKVAAAIKTEGRINVPHVRLPAFPMAIRAEGDMVVRSGSWHTGTVGTAESVQDRGFSYPSQPFTLPASGDNQGGTPRGRVTLPAVAGEVATVFTIRSKDLFNSLPNKIRADVVNVSVLVVPNGAGSGVVQTQLLGNVSNFTVAPVYTDVAPASVLEVDDVAGNQSVGRYDPANPSGFLVGEPLNIPYIGGQGNQSSTFGREATLVQELQLDGIAGETLTCIARDLNGNAPDLYWFITWIERQI